MANYDHDYVMQMAGYYPEIPGHSRFYAGTVRQLVLSLVAKLNELEKDSGCRWEGNVLSSMGQIRPKKGKEVYIYLQVFANAEGDLNERERRRDILKTTFETIELGIAEAQSLYEKKEAKHD